MDKLTLRQFLVRSKGYVITRADTVLCGEDYIEALEEERRVSDGDITQEEYSRLDKPVHLVEGFLYVKGVGHVLESTRLRWVQDEKLSRSSYWPRPTSVGLV